MFKWFDQWPWLAYSISLNAAFCFPCVLLGDSFPKKSCKSSFLFSKPFKDWGQATIKFAKHEGSDKCQNKSFDGLHKYTSQALAKLLSDFSGETESIAITIDKQRKKLVNTNRSKLFPIIENVIFCAGMDFFFREHRDDFNLFL